MTWRQTPRVPLPAVGYRARVTRTALARPLAAIVALVSISVLFWPNSGPEQAAGTTTTLSVNSSVPWVDRSTPVDEELELDYELFYERLDGVELWLEEYRGLAFREPPEVVIIADVDLFALDEDLRSQKDYPWPEYEVVLPLFGITLGEFEHLWPPTYGFEGRVVVPEDMISWQGDPSYWILSGMSLALLDDQFDVGGRLDELQRSGAPGDRYDVIRFLALGESAFLVEGYGWFLSTGSWDPGSQPCFTTGFFGMSFLYSAASRHTCELYANGGWEAVDSVHRNPPDSTAELLGVACEAGNVSPTELSAVWSEEVFAADRGALWFRLLMSQRTAGEGFPNSWCFDHQRVVERADGARMLVMDIWLATDADAEHVADAVNSVFRNADNDVDHRVVQDGSWVGIASTLDDVDLCAEFPDWCG